MDPPNSKHFICSFYITANFKLIYSIRQRTKLRKLGSQEGFLTAVSEQLAGGSLAQSRRLNKANGEEPHINQKAVQHKEGGAPMLGPEDIHGTQLGSFTTQTTTPQRKRYFEW